MKKLQSLLQLAEPVQGDEAIEAMRAGIRKVKDALTARRDADVLSDLGRELGVRQVPLRGKRPDIVKLGELLRDLVDAADRMNLEALTWESVTQSHLKTCRHARKAWKKAQEHPKEKALHAWRKRVKDQYHQSLALHRWLGQEEKIRRMRRLGSLLGKCHDLDLFVSIVDEADAGHAHRKLKRKVGHRRTKLTRRIFRRAKKVFAKPVSKTKRRVQARLAADHARPRRTR